jgi:hypothetical protein
MIQQKLLRQRKRPTKLDLLNVFIGTIRIWKSLIYTKFEE